MRGLDAGGDEVTEHKHLMTYFDNGGELQCVNGPGAPAIPAEFASALPALYQDLGLAIDCVDVFGGVPAPVAKKILEGLDTVRTALDMALRSVPAEREAR